MDKYKLVVKKCKYSRNWKRLEFVMTEPYPFPDEETKKDVSMAYEKVIVN